MNAPYSRPLPKWQISVNRRLFLVGLALLASIILLLGSPALTSDVVEAQGCSISRFDYSHHGQVPHGTRIVYSVQSNCGTVKFTIQFPDGHVEDRAETGGGNQTWTWHSDEGPTGTYLICAVARGEGGWERANRSCVDAYLYGAVGSPPGSTPGENNRAWINSFTATPSTVRQGETIYLSGSYTCDGGCQTSFYRIDGTQYGEGTSPVNNVNWNTSNASVGTHRICFVARAAVSGAEAESCVNVTVLAREAPPPTPAAVQGPPADNGQPGQTGQSGPGGVYNPTQVPSSNSGGSSSPSVGQARQSGTNGGVDLIIWCYAQGATGAGNSNNTENGWYCDFSGNHRSVDWNQVCRDVYGGNYLAVFTGGMNGIRCQSGGSSSSGGSSGNSGGSSGSSGGNSQSGCPSSPATARAGDIVTVVDVDTSPLNLRSYPGFGDNVVTTIPVGTQFTIISSNYVCAGGWRWYESGHNGQIGWTGEVGPQRMYNYRGSLSGSSGSGNSNSGSSGGNSGSGSSGGNISGSGSGATGGNSGSNTGSGSTPNTGGRAAVCASVPARLVVGQQGRVIIDGHGSVNVRTNPGGELITTMAEGATFTTLSEPVCQLSDAGNANTWRRVQLPNGTVGWTIEAQNSRYVLESYGGSSAVQPTPTPQPPLVGTIQFPLDFDVNASIAFLSGFFDIDWTIARERFWMSVGFMYSCGMSAVQIVAVFATVAGTVTAETGAGALVAITGAAVLAFVDPEVIADCAVDANDFGSMIVDIWRGVR